MPPPASQESPPKSSLLLALVCASIVADYDLVFTLPGGDKRRGDEPTAAHTLYNLIDRRHSRVSTAVTSNIALSDWGRYLGDATLTAAILDRLAMHAIRINITGPSWRQHVAKARAERAATDAPPR